MKKRNTEQVYLIKKINCEKNKGTTYIEHIYKDYSETRRKAWGIVRKLNMKKLVNEFSTDYKKDNELKEVTPDIWTDGNIVVTIEVLPLENISKREITKREDKIVEKSFRKIEMIEVLQQLPHAIVSKDLEYNIK